VHTLKVIMGGFALLAVCLLVGRLVGGAAPVAMARAAMIFIVLWLLGAGINLWVGVSRAGYTLAEEAPVFLLVFGVPAAVAALLAWRWSHG
jgi:hypothetical protein